MEEQVGMVAVRGSWQAYWVEGDVCYWWFIGSGCRRSRGW